MAECKVPESMVPLIFCRLPPKSLMRFKCIQKSWNSLINSRHFVAEHLRFHNNLSSSTTILLRRPVSCRDIVCSLLTLRSERDGQEDNLNFDIEDIHFPPSIGLITRAQFIENHGHTRDCADIVGHCCGIICLSLYHPSDLVLYNPAIKAFKLIPEPCLPGLREIDFRSTAFGYDPVSEDFILVIIASFGYIYYGEGGGRLALEPLRAEMYTTSTDSWKEIKIANLENETTMFRPYHFQLYHEGNCYALAMEVKKEFMESYDSLEDYGREAIVWFDTRDWVFHTALTPDSLYVYPAHDFTLTVWNNCVALFGYHRPRTKPWFDEEESQHFAIWVMGDFDGFTLSWIKQMTVDIADSPLTLALWESNRSVLISPRVRIALYSFATKSYTYLPIYAADYFYAFPLVSSLIPLSRDLVCDDTP
ncbi:F-box protein At4g22390-like [Argentina anserina]|uniref:F-box protein At4g22390-like n=1 Tax=Argentina anserina TaxID=57926 RepID=UPI00217678DB|nr:F-box protein At4g22390-like [Potentilla anserina]